MSKTIFPTLAAALLSLGILFSLSCKPADSLKGTPADLLNNAWTQFRLANFELAERDFKAALGQLEKADSVDANHDRLRLNGLYGLGLVYSLGFHGERTDEAKNSLRQVINLDQSPDKTMASWAALALVREQYIPVNSALEPDVPSLVKAYSEVAATYPNTPAGQEAVLYGNALRLQDRAPENLRKVIADIDAYLASNKDRLFQSSLYSLKTNAQMGLKEYQAAFNSAEKAFATKEIDPRNPNSTLASDYFSLALSAEFDVGDFAKARDYFHKFLAKYPEDQKSFLVQLELQRMDDIEAKIKAGVPIDEAIRTPLTQLRTPNSNDVASPATMPSTQPASLSSVSMRWEQR